MWVICSSCQGREQRSWSAMRANKKPRCCRCGGPLNTFREAGLEEYEPPPEPATQRYSQTTTPRKLKGGLEL